MNLTSRRTPGRQHDHHAGRAQRVPHAGADCAAQAAGDFVTYRLEREFTKEEILALYLNVIFFGQRSYGVAAAAETYFGKQLDDLSLGEAATLARVPQWPSNYNPITNPQGATDRRKYVLRRMRELGFIDEAAAQAASQEVVSARAHRALADVEAPYVAEMVRLEIMRRFGPQAQEAGYKVYTTIDGRLQTAANHALRIGLVDYTRRHGWRGAVNKVELSGRENPGISRRLLDEYGTIGNLQPALVMSVAEKQAEVFIKGEGPATIEWAGMSWATRRANELGARVPNPRPPARSWRAATSSTWRTKRRTRPPSWCSFPMPKAPSSRWIPNNGAILSLVGGFDYFEGRGMFNRVTMAKRQPGSGFKPFLYSAALAGELHSGVGDPRRTHHHGRSQPGRGVAAAKFRRRLRRSDAPARGAGAVAQPGVDPAAARNGRQAGHRLRQPFWLHAKEPAA